MTDNSGTNEKAKSTLAYLLDNINEKSEIHIRTSMLVAASLLNVKATSIIDEGTLIGFTCTFSNGEVLELLRWGPDPRPVWVEPDVRDDFEEEFKKALEK